MALQLNLLPQPRSMSLTGGALDLTGSLIALAADPAAQLLAAGRRAQAALKRAGIDAGIAGGAHDDVLLTISLDPSLHAEGYHLSIKAGGIRIAGADPAGAFYGAVTLAQILAAHEKSLPLLEIDDHPDFAARGVMLDVSRDKVPTMETVYALVDWLADLKINQFQLYTEHTFAYRQHPKVWAEASPFTAEEILALDAYCRERFVELVPNQNSFGHMHRWTKFADYLPLAETDVSTIEWSDAPFSISPVVPESIMLIEGLYDELLPNFTSRMFNVGADETFDLGHGKSAAAVAERGKGRVYLDFLLEIYQRVKSHGRTMQFWGDIINQYPDLVPEVPKDTIALEWGYEANHPFDEKSALFANSGIPFYVCPGTSSWQTIAGRTDNMIGNIRSAVENGLKHGAIGVLNTDWGDLGHWQQLPISYAGFAYGAAMSWNAEGSREIDLSAALDAYAFGDSAGVMGKLALDLGNAYQQTGVLIGNSTMLNAAYYRTLDHMRGRWKLGESSMDVLHNDSLLLENLYETIAYIDAIMQPLDNAQMDRADSGLIVREFRHAAHMLQHGARRVLLQLGDDSIRKADLLADLNAIIDEQRALWLARNRPGGLKDSLVALEKAREMYR